LPLQVLPASYSTWASVTQLSVSNTSVMGQVPATWANMTGLWTPPSTKITKAPAASPTTRAPAGATPTAVTLVAGTAQLKADRVPLGLDNTYVTCYEAPYWLPASVPYSYYQPPGCEAVIPQVLVLEEEVQAKSTGPGGAIGAIAAGALASAALLAAAAAFLGRYSGRRAAERAQEDLPLLVRLVVDVSDGSERRGHSGKRGVHRPGSDGSFVADATEGGAGAAAAAVRRALPRLPAFPAAPASAALVLDLADDGGRDAKGRRKKDRRSDSAEGLVEARGFKEERGGDRDRDGRRGEGRRGEGRKGESRRSKGGRGDDQV
jgi:hypothetical protein